jgi:hypothetical protein
MNLYVGLKVPGVAGAQRVRALCSAVGAQLCSRRHQGQRCRTPRGKHSSTTHHPYHQPPAPIQQTEREAGAGDGHSNGASGARLYGGP